MKTLKSHLLSILLLACAIAFSIGKSSGQDRLGIKNDPRYYIKIYEEPSTPRQDFKPAQIWSWDTTNSQGIQDQKYVDVNSILSIQFDINALSSDIEFVGSISLEAKINGRNAEISPYYQTGQEAAAIGVSQFSPRELSIRFYSFLISLEKLKNSGSELERLIITDSIYNQGIRFYDFEPKKYRINFDLTTIKTNMNNILTQARLLSSYLQTFSGSIGDDSLSPGELPDQEAQRVLLRLIDTDKKLAKRFHSDLIGFIKSIKMIVDKPQMDIEDIGPIINAFSVLSPYFDSIVLSDPELRKYISDSNKVEIGIKRADKGKQEFITELSEIMGKSIYRKLVVGKINLKELDVKEGDIVKISAVLFGENQQGNIDPKKDKKVYELALFYAKETGWRIKVYDSFFLVDFRGSLRPDPPAGSTLANPAESFSGARYKLAPGVTFLATYGNPRRFTYRGKLWRALEPSFGLTVSFLDFYSDKDLEIGFGPTIGLFRNQVFLHYGYNLSSKDGDTGHYVGLGFSFARIAETINKSTKKD